MDNIKTSLDTFVLPSWKEIPDVGLYLDQVTKYINSFLVDFPEMVVTPSMISNYVKLKIVDKPEKKVYNREQIARFLFIAMSKTVVSMNHIKRIFVIQKKSYTPEEAYTYFQTELKQALVALYDTQAKDIKKDISEEQRMVKHIVVAIAHKVYLEKYFEQENK